LLQNTTNGPEIEHKYNKKYYKIQQYIPGNTTNTTYIEQEIIHKIQQ